MSIDFEKIGREAVERVYGTIPEAPPKGWEFTGEFRALLRGDIMRDSQLDEAQGPVVNPRMWGGEPRLILRRKMVRRVVGWTVRKLGRPPQPGEWCLEKGSKFPELGLRRSDSTADQVWASDEAVSFEDITEEVPEPTE